MGFFSWETSDTGRSISNVHSCRGAFPVHVLIPQEFGGGWIKEENYDGYGVFGERDVYALVANWNCPEKCVGNDEEDRHLGIDLTYSGRQLKYTIKITEHPMAYEEAEPSNNCDEQGFFYNDNIDEDEDDYEEEEEED